MFALSIASALVPMALPYVSSVPLAIAEADTYAYQCSYRIGDSTDRYYVTVNATDSLDAIRQIKSAHSDANSIVCAKGKKVQ